MMRMSAAREKGFLMVILLIFVAVFSVVNAPRVEAAGLTFSASTTASLTGTGDALTVAGGSTASTTQIGTTTMVVALENGNSITVSVANKSFSATGQSSSSVITRNTLCYLNTGDQQGIVILTATQNETVTLSTAACGQYSSRAGEPQTLPTYTTIITPPTPTPTPTPTPPPAGPFTPLPESPTVNNIKDAIAEVIVKIAELQANLNVPDILNRLQQVVTQVTKIQQAIVGGSLPAGSVITQPLNQGSSGDQVTALQNFLKSQGSNVYPEGLVTGYFGPLTREAVERFQEKYGIANEGDPGYGFAGPKTREKINSLLGL